MIKRTSTYFRLFRFIYIVIITSLILLGVILATISTIGFKCTVEVEKKDGTITVIHGKES